MSRAWYLAALVPLAIGVVVGVLAIKRMIEHVESLHRLVVPGEKTLMLDEGDYVVYAETESSVDGVAFVNDRFSVECTLVANGQPLALERPTGSTKYSIGGYSGHSIFTFDMPASTSATLRCTSEGGKAVLAIGTGIGGGIVVGVVALVFGILGAGGAFTIIYIRRRQFLQRSGPR
jgi:hypothetical protein